METTLYPIIAIVAVLFVTFAAILSRYKRCPSDKILVVYGRTGKTKPEQPAPPVVYTVVLLLSGLYSKATLSWTLLRFPSNAT